MVKKRVPEKKGVIGESIRFPFRAMRRIWMYYWNFIPILGWIFLGKYTIDVINTAAKNGRELPKWQIDWKRGFLFMLAGGIWSIIIYVLGYWDYGWIPDIYIGLILPVMLGSYALGDKIAYAFDFITATKVILRNFKQYLILWWRTIVITIIYLIFTIPIITGIVTIPAAYFSYWYLLALFLEEARL